MKVEKDAGVLRLTLDRPERLNAVTDVILDELAEAVEKAPSDPDVRVIVLAGEGRAFCSGADISGDTDADEASTSTIDAGERLVRAVTTSPLPVVALARGVVAGIGVPIALAADLTLSDEDSYFLLAFTRIGLMPDGGASALVAASIGRARALRMALLAEKLPAGEAAAAGLIGGVYPAADYEAEVQKILDQLSTGPAVAYARTKESINEATLGPLNQTFKTELAGQTGLLKAADFAEGQRAFAEKRSPQFSDRP